jgi:Concanavalin A-like lectin/glucanases superfamily
MKNINILLLTFLLGACSVDDKEPNIIKPYFIGDTKITPPTTPPPSNGSNTGSGLIAYYPFNGNANDASGNNNHGIVDGAKLSNDRFVVANKAYRFSDGNEIVVRNSNSLNLPNAFTFNLWVNMLSTTGRNGNNAITTNSEQCIFTKNCDGGHLRCAIYPQSNGTFLLETYANNGFQTTIPFQLNQWKMISIIYDGTTLKHFVNGNLIASKSITLNLGLTNNSDLVIGNMGCFTYYFNGLIDDFRVYNRALSDNEIQTLFKQ